MPERPSGSARRTRRRSRPSRGRPARRAAPAAATSATIGTSNGRPFVQSRRDAGGWPHGLPTPSMFRNAPLSSAGKRESSSTRFRRRPTILSTCSMRTGQASTQAPQVTQSQTASNGMAPSTIGFARRSAWTVSSRPYVSRTIAEFGMSGRPCSASTDISRMPMMKCFGLRGLPVFQAGQASWQRPHSVQVKPSSMSFQPRSASVRTPNVASSASRSIAGSSPRGSSFRK